LKKAVKAVLTAEWKELFDENGYLRPGCTGRLEEFIAAPVLREPDQPVMSPNIINTLKNKLINLLKNIFRFR